MEAMAQASNDEHAVEVTEKAKRRQYSAAYKLKILQEADSCTKAPSITSLGTSNVGRPTAICPRNNAKRASQIYSTFSSLRGALNITTDSTGYL